MVERVDNPHEEQDLPATYGQFDSLAHFNTAGLDSSTIAIMNMAKKPRTVQSYASYLKRFSQWCKDHNVDPHRASWQQRLACLSEYASNAVLSTRSLINMRSAISMNTSLVNGTPFGQLPEVQMFIKGLRRRNPVPQQPSIHVGISLTWLPT
jgi:hypothetical protein